MPRRTSLRSVGLVALGVAAIAVAMVLAVASMLGAHLQKTPPELTLQQLAAARIPDVHPVSQADAIEVGCRCHIEVAQEKR